ncbi:MAG TPA: FMN-binding protein [Aeromonadales bacterium]|nr:FMN-binding protein [Aeromonadales bacterium]
MKTFIVISIIIFLGNQVAVARGVYQQPAEFLSDVFQKEVPEVNYFWLTGDKKNAVKNILGHAYSKLRLKYWIKKDRIVWILDEIGKEEPITLGIVVKRDHIEQLKVLIYRESRGEEVRHTFFTSQFKGITLDKNKRLSQSIDGITGATLSVRALKRLSRLALWLSEAVLSKRPAESSVPTLPLSVKIQGAF